MPEQTKLELPDQMLTTGDLLRQIQWRMKAIMDGRLPHDTAKLLQRESYLALKVAELSIKASRETRALRGRGREFNIITGSVELPEQEDKIV